jgi:hypothetical protein
MPNWIGNTIILTGTADEIQKLHETGFDFEKLSPPPPPSEASADWCDHHWGTKWSADIEKITYEPGSTTMKVDCRTANGAPYGLLAFLTLQSPTLRISHTIEQEYGYIMGHVVYEEGIMNGGQFYPALYTADTLRSYGEANPWFHAENIINTVVGMGGSLEKGDTEIVMSPIRGSYDDYVAWQVSMAMPRTMPSQRSSDKDGTPAGVKKKVIVKKYVKKSDVQ